VTRGAAVAEIDRVPRLNPSHRWSDAVDHAGSVPPEDGGKCGPDRSVGAQLVVDRINAGGPHVHTDIVLGIDASVPALRSAGERPDRRRPS
jgi:hypothetical protein